MPLGSGGELGKPDMRAGANDRLGSERPRRLCTAAVFGGETKYFFAQRLAGKQRGAAGDEGAGTAIGTGIMPPIVGVRG